jgi:5-methylcytosine-specific restriction endonuclease McrA
MSTQTILRQPVLMLNRRWQAIQTTPAANAVALVAKGSATIIDPATCVEYTLESWADVSRAREAVGTGMLRSPQWRLAVPEVIRLLRYERMGGRGVVFSRRNLFRRDRHTCQYCGGRPGTEELTVDHVLPRSRGGRSEWENCVLACTACNARKADRTPAEAGMRLRQAPRRPHWTSLELVPRGQRRMSWRQFLSRAYWDVELEP